MSVETPELRAEKYDTKDRDEMAKSGEAMPDGSYPIKDTEDLQNAIHAVGRGSANHDAIRRHIIARAKAIGQADAIPDSWNADGSLKQANMTSAPLARRKKERHRAVPLMPEVRFFHTDKIEVRSADEAGNLVALHGLVIRYGVGYEVHDRAGVFEETMTRGVAADVMDGDTRFLFNHDGMPLARTAAGTMALTDSPEGLWVDPILDTRMQLANDLVIATERGDINQMSVGFLVGDDSWNAARDQRTVKRFKAMPDVSAVTYPASPSTTLDLAHRMASEMIGDPERARVRRVFMDVRGLDLRAGAVLSAKNAEAIGNAIKTLHGVYDGAGLDASSLLDNDDEPDDDTIEDAELPQDGATDSAGSGDDGDDANVRQRDPGEPIRVPATRTERRAATESFNDLQQAIYQALLARFSDGDGNADLWITDCGEDWVVFESFLKPAGTFRLSYATGDEGAIVLDDGEPQRVNSHTVWEPLDAPDGRAAVSVIELRARASALRGRRHRLVA